MLKNRVIIQGQDTMEHVYLWGQGVERMDGIRSVSLDTKLLQNTTTILYSLLIMVEYRVVG